MVTITRSTSTIQSCPYSPFGLSSTPTFTLHRVRLDVQATITDLATNQRLDAKTFTGGPPSTCPRTISHGVLETSRTTDGALPSPSASGFARWVVQSLAGSASSGLATLTPTLTPTPLPTVVVADLTPVAKGNTLVVTSFTIVRDEADNWIAQVTQGEYPLFGLTQRSYVILYEGAPAFVLLSSRNAHPSMPFTSTPSLTPIHTFTPMLLPTVALVDLTPVAKGNTLVVTGLTIVRDEGENHIAQITRGEYPLIGLTARAYVILYEGAPAFVLLSSKNAHPSMPFTPTPSPSK
jgi:hypothetical protein